MELQEVGVVLQQSETEKWRHSERESGRLTRGVGRGGGSQCKVFKSGVVLVVVAIRGGIIVIQCTFCLMMGNKKKLEED